MVVSSDYSTLFVRNFISSTAVEFFLFVFKISLQRILCFILGIEFFYSQRKNEFSTSLNEIPINLEKIQKAASVAVYSIFLKNPIPKIRVVAENVVV